MGIAASSSSSPTTEAVPPREAAAAPPTADPQDGGADGAAESKECGVGEEWCFCRFMKYGGCKEEFVAFEKCVNEAAAAGEDVLERCGDEGRAIRKCMDAHADYYEPILRAVDSLAEEGAAAAETAAVAAECSDCWFRLYLKGGGCKEEIVAWDKCVEEAEAAGKADPLQRCLGILAAVKQCMEAHADYYEPVLRKARAIEGDLKAGAGVGGGRPEETGG